MNKCLIIIVGIFYPEKKTNKKLWQLMRMKLSEKTYIAVADALRR